MPFLFTNETTSIGMQFIYLLFFLIELLPKALRHRFLEPRYKRNRRSWRIRRNGCVSMVSGASSRRSTWFDRTTAKTGSNRFVNDLGVNHLLNRLPVRLRNFKPFSSDDKFFKTG